MKPLACALLGLVLAACSGGASPSSSGFPADALTTVTSSSGALHIEVRSSPQPPVRGTDDLQLSVTSTSDGKPLDGLTIKATPWMPAMNHGSADATVRLATMPVPPTRTTGTLWAEAGCTHNAAVASAAMPMNRR